MPSSASARSRRNASTYAICQSSNSTESRRLQNLGAIGEFDRSDCLILIYRAIRTDVGASIEDHEDSSKTVVGGRLSECDNRDVDELRGSDIAAGDARAVVLVEGISDRIAIETLAARYARNLDNEGISIVPIGGAEQWDAS